MASVRVAVLLRKRGRQEVLLEPDYVRLRHSRIVSWSATVWITTTNIAICRTWRCCRTSDSEVDHRASEQLASRRGSS